MRRCEAVPGERCRGRCSSLTWLGGSRARWPLRVCPKSWSGDSRLYLVRGTEIFQVSRDHTEVQELFAVGTISAEEAHTWNRNIITRAIGVFDVPELDMESGALEPGDTFVVYSDGLTNHIDDGVPGNGGKSKSTFASASSRLRTVVAGGFLTIAASPKTCAVIQRRIQRAVA